MSVVQSAHMKITVQDVIDIAKELGVTATCGNVVDALIALEISLTLPTSTGRTALEDNAIRTNSATSVVSDTTSERSSSSPNEEDSSIVADRSNADDQDPSQSLKPLATPPTYEMAVVHHDTLCCIPEDVSSHPSPVLMSPHTALLFANSSSSSVDHNYPEDSDSDSPMSDYSDRGSRSLLSTEMELDQLWYSGVRGPKAGVSRSQ
ncbi:hypothetical protein NMY22_g13492 [Coprinellus aureogranulatus]|nr:hypothetical protein NMY22_g13492 [Coprinellus aureogranulatus]